jgi:hypothetical protein
LRSTPLSSASSPVAAQAAPSQPAPHRPIAGRRSQAAQSGVATPSKQIVRCQLVPSRDPAHWPTNGRAFVQGKVGPSPKNLPPRECDDGLLSERGEIGIHGWRCGGDRTRATRPVVL